MSFCSLIAYFFLVLNNSPLYGWYHILFMHLSIDENLGCFQVRAIMNKAIINTHAQDLCGREFSTHLGRCQGLYT